MLHLLTFSCQFVALYYCTLRCFLLLSVPASYSFAGLSNPGLKACHGAVSESGYLTDFWFLSDSGFEPESEIVPESDPGVESEIVSPFDSDSDYRSVPSWQHLS
jgi:hypothetical protein